MAELTFWIFDLEGNKKEVENVLTFELQKDIGAACDGLRLSFLSAEPLFEIYSIEAYSDNEKIFFGYCDTQRETVSKNGTSVFVYARSSASILVDNEARPFAYNSPSALSLFNHNAKELGFRFRLENLSCAYPYTVSKGTSCYGAINDFVYALSGKNIIVNSENELVLLNGDETVYLDNSSIISEKRVINRGLAVSRIDYKRESADGYKYHIKSRLLEDKKINCSRKLNLSSLAQWQKQNVLINKLRSASSSYYETELILDGFYNFSLYDNVEYISSFFGQVSGYYISGVCLSMNKSGLQTKLVINKQIDLKEINYVAE